MAFVTQFQCQECRQERYEAVTSFRICVACRTAIDKAQEDYHMQRLAVLPIDERVRRLELALYSLNADSRLKALEVAHVKYA